MNEHTPPGRPLEARAQELEARVEEQVRSATKKLRATRERVEDFIREHPAACLVGAFAIGYLLARAARNV